MREERMWSGDDRYAGGGEPDPLAGTLVGQLALRRRLGAGNSGSVYLAEHTMIKTFRAVKLLLPQLTRDPVAVERFVHEARAASRLHHRNLIQLHDVGQLPRGAWFMVLDYLNGWSLARMLAAQAGPVPLRMVIHIVSQVANGLQVAHDRGIVHGDLTPSNVFLGMREGDSQHVVLLDFGVAQLGEQPASRPYLPPESVPGAVSRAADVFALGVIAYRMTTGRLPRPGDPRDGCAGLSPACASALLSAIDPDPAKRPASAKDFALRLARAIPALNGLPDGLTIVRTFARELLEAGTSDARSVAGPAGQGLAGPRYELGDKLGTGGMAEVFSGAMIGAEGFVRRVAIKRVLSGLSQVPAFATMFAAEAQIASRLAHPNIVSVLDFNRDPEQRLFLVMEYVDGKDLASLLATGPIAPSLVIFITIELLRGLGYLHDLRDPESGTRGVVHRDVSPQNLLLSYEGAVKLSDFGLARTIAVTDGVWSETVRGKPSYMSPEQIEGKPLDRRTDLYAVGVMLWEMLAHRPLFVGASHEIMGQVLYRSIARPSAIRRDTSPECGDVPADLEAIAMRLLARDRVDRYPTAEAAIEALLRCQDVPRDGRGELVHVLADRFPRDTRPPPPRIPSTNGPPRPAHVTVTAPSLVSVPRSSSVPVRSRLGLFTATRWTMVLAGLAIAVAVAIARGATPSDPPAPPAPRAPTAGPGSAPGDAGTDAAPDPECKQPQTKRCDNT